MEAPPLASLSLTHVHYDPTDPISKVCAYLALAPQALVITYVSLMWATREVEILLMFAGQMGCEALNWVLKRWIKEERPTQMQGKGYGMPSSHAQFGAFFAIYLSLFLVLRHNSNGAVTSRPTTTPHVPTPFYQRLLLAVVCLAFSVTLAGSRIYLMYHTPRQVYAGAALGASCAIAWFAAVSVARRLGLLERLLDVPLARWARLRDLVVSEDLAHAGWERWELRKRQAGGQGIQTSGGAEAKKTA